MITFPFSIPLKEYKSFLVTLKQSLILFKLQYYSQTQFTGTMMLAFSQEGKKPLTQKFRSHALWKTVTLETNIKRS